MKIIPLLMERTEGRQGTLDVGHRNVIRNERETRELCNCRVRKNCPLDNSCLLDNIVYEAKVETENKTFRYIGCTGTSFKKRWSNHLHSFRNPGMRNTTSLAKVVQDLKDRKIKHSIKSPYYFFSRPIHGLAVHIFSQGKRIVSV